MSLIWSAILSRIVAKFFSQNPSTPSGLQAFQSGIFLICTCATTISVVIALFSCTDFTLAVLSTTQPLTIIILTIELKMLYQNLDININAKFRQNPFAIQNSEKSHGVIKKIKSKVPVDDINNSMRWFL